MMHSMPSPLMPPGFLDEAWKILLLYLSPVGSGIPAGVVYAQSRGITWPAMAIVYLFSDVIFAFFFEPLMMLFIRKSKTNPKLARVREALAMSTNQMFGHLAIRPGPLTIVLITFGSVPAIGRPISYLAGHGFFAGWTLTIIGDMLYFFMIMASTIWLNGILGNGTLTAVIITVLAMVFPSAVKAVKRRMGWGSRAPQ
jgi:hypothetical protein